MFLFIESGKYNMLLLPISFCRSCLFQTPFSTVLLPFLLC